MARKGCRFFLKKKKKYVYIYISSSFFFFSFSFFKNKKKIIEMQKKIKKLLSSYLPYEHSKFWREIFF